MMANEVENDGSFTNLKHHLYYIYKLNLPYTLALVCSFYQLVSLRTITEVTAISVDTNLLAEGVV